MHLWSEQVFSWSQAHLSLLETKAFSASWLRLVRREVWWPQEPHDSFPMLLWPRVALQVRIDQDLTPSNLAPVYALNLHIVLPLNCHPPFPFPQPSSPSIYKRRNRLENGERGEMMHSFWEILSVRWL